MSDRVALKRTATAGRLAIAGLTAAFLGGCSADALRMESFSNPLAGLSNPFSSDTTGSIESQAPRRAARAAAPRASTFVAPSAPGAASVAKYAPPVGGPTTGWSAAGGSSIVVANGESLNILSQRYGVPEQAILKANNLSSASQISPGSRITIPVYNAAGSASAARTTAAAPKFVGSATPSRASAAADETRAAQARLDQERARLAAARKEAAQAKAELEAEKRKAAIETRRAQSANLAAQTKDAKADKARAEAERAALKAKQDRLARLRADEAATQKKIAAAKADVKKQARVEAKARDDEAKEEKRLAARDKATRVAEAKSDAARKAELAKAEARRKSADANAEAAKKAAEMKAAKAKKLAESKTDQETRAAAVKAEKEAKLAAAKAAAEQKKAAAEQKAAKAKAEEETTKVARSEAVRPDSVKPDSTKPEPATTASVKPDEKAASAANGNPEFRWPARGRVIQTFRANGNDGINIALPEGTAVKAAESGVVAYAGAELKNLGNLVLIRHPNGFVSAYAHNGEIEVKRGDTVKRGQTIAKSGQSGAVQSPQLHFELRKGSTPVNPTEYLAGL